MQSEPTPTAKTIFLDALELEPEMRSAFVRKQCHGNEDLVAEVEELLAAQSATSFLQNPPNAQLRSTADMRDQQSSKLKLQDSQIGPYKIRELIGEGGMGSVYVAEQDKPLRRKVALKVIKTGMDSKAVLGRFEAERQALALMNHPNIAKVLDAGMTAEGRSYFVMELIQGMAITEYCDQKKLTIGQRLDLFVSVCSAIQHAHQKGVINRDIKLPNVLVTEVDGKPIPKVIDFGVAKALGAKLTDRTVYTGFQSIIGTPLYMSPEQTQLSGVDVDTSSDVYSLGILLYELLTGTTPLSADDLKQAAHDELMRRIRETEPPRPSTRITSLGEKSLQISDCRSAELEQLSRLMRGDLDWIVMKSLEKERDRRYKTADALAADVVRHMRDEPVEARPPSTAYRLSCLYRKNRTGVTFALMLVGLLAVLLPVTSVGWLKASHAEREAKEQRDMAEKYAKALRTEFLGRAVAEVQSGDMRRGKLAIDRAKNFGVDSDSLVILEALNLSYSGDQKSARDIVKPLLKKPDHVAAVCVMIMANFDDDNPSEYFRYHAMLSNPVPPSADDVLGNLLLAQVLLHRDPQLAFNITQNLVAQHPFGPTARALHGSAMILLAVDTPNVERRAKLIEQGVVMLERADKMAPNNEFVMTEYLAGLAYAVEFGLSTNHELTDVWKFEIDQLTERAADRDWKNRRFDSLRIHYLAAMGDGDVELLREELLARDNPARSLIMNSLRHYGEKEFESFSSELGFSESGEARIIRAFLQIEQDCPEVRRARAHRICFQDFPPTMHRSCEWHSVAINLLLLAGDKEAAKDYAAKSLEAAPIYADRWAFRTLEYLADPTPEHKARLSALAHPFSDPMGYIELAFGMQAFAEGNREKALEHFRKSAATGKLDWFSPCIADAMLRRMEDESAEDWPAWIEWQ